MNTIIRLWRGDLPLAVAFWRWAVAGGLAVNLATSALFLALAANDRIALALLAGYGVSIPYNLLATVGVWRAATRYGGDPRRAEAARLVTLAGMLLLSVT